MIRKVKIKTATADIVLEALDSLSLEEFLRSKHLPPNLFQVYARSAGDSLKPILSNTHIADVPKSVEIIIQCIRNTDLRDVIPQKTFYKKTNDPVAVVSSLNLGGVECTQTVQEINPQQAKDIVKDKISGFLGEYSKAKLIMVGISGGGDSNTLARGLKKFSVDHGLNKFFSFFTLVFDPLWPQSAADRASELCRENDVPHRICGPQEIKQLLNMKDGLDVCYADFCDTFGANTSHFFGTYLISLAARKLCRDAKTDEYILGFNREDILAELLFSLMNGQKPLSFPVRKFAEISLLMPLWEIPKLILDACYPQYSLPNYQERKDETTFQRNIIYYLAHGIEDVYDNLGLSLMHGIRKIFSNDWAKLGYDKDFDLYASVYADEDRKKEVTAFLDRHFNH